MIHKILLFTALGSPTHVHKCETVAVPYFHAQLFCSDIKQVKLKFVDCSSIYYIQGEYPIFPAVVFEGFACVLRQNFTSKTPVF